MTKVQSFYYGLILLIVCGLALLGLKLWYSSQAVQAQQPEASAFTIKLEATWDRANQNLLFINSEIYENSQTVHGPYVAREGAADPTAGQWFLKGYFYEYVEQARFTCNNEIMDNFLGLADDPAVEEQWIIDNGLSSEWSQQQATFEVVAPKFHWKQTDNSWAGSVEKKFNSIELASSTKVAYCLQVKRHDGSDTTLNNIVINNKEDLSQSTIGVDLGDKLPTADETDSGDQSGSSQQADEGSQQDSSNQADTNQDTTTTTTTDTDDTQTTSKTAGKTAGKTPDTAGEIQAPIGAFLAIAAIIITVSGAWIYSHLRHYRV